MGIYDSINPLFQTSNHLFLVGNHLAFNFEINIYKIISSTHFYSWFGLISRSSIRGSKLGGPNLNSTTMVYLLDLSRAAFSL